SSVVFAHEGHDNISVAHATQIQVVINNFAILKNSNSVEILFKAREGMANPLDLLDSYNTILTKDGTDFLSGDLSIELTNNIPGLSEISLTLKALHFGEVSNTTTNVVVKVANVDKAERITVSSADFVEVGENSEELRMSFIDVLDGGYCEKDFNASVEFATAKSPTSIRFEEIEKALTYVLYEYEINEDGEIVNTKRIQNDFLNISFYEGKVKVRAYKSRGGGLFRLVLVTKDSYINPRDPDEIITEEVDFLTKYALTIRIEDGEIGSEYIIETEEELMLINYNLDSNFVLGANITITSSTFAPIGLIGGALKAFEGTLSGQLITIVDELETVSTTYSITLNVNKYVDSTEGYRIYALFAILDEDAQVKNLNINASFDADYVSTLTSGAKIGAVAGVNRGLIKNVSVKIVSNGTTKFDGISNYGVDFGGIAGVNDSTGEIENSKVENLNEFTISSVSKIVHNIGLIAGTNAGTISGNYEGKESLDNFIFDIVANLKVVNTAIDGAPVYNVGSVVGCNSGNVENLLVGGQILVGNNGDNIQNGYLGGFVGTSNEGEIKTLTALSLNLSVSSNKVNVGGIVGKAEDTEIDNVKYVSVVTKFSTFKTAGQINGKALVAGVVAESVDSVITNSSVESFVDTIKDEVIGTVGETFYSISGGTTTAGLVANISGTNVDKSFVQSNIKGTNIVLTTNASETNTYFMGKVNTAQTIKYNGTDVLVTIGLYMDDIVVSDETTDWTNIYYVDNTNYVQAETYDSAKVYKKFNVAEWIAFAKNIIPSVTDWDNDDDWKIQENYNVIKINGVKVFFPYLVEDEEAIMIVAPQDIKA
ncbi:MAG: hypothetical protein IKY10_04245, partial [Clostridia bacterium]|nr:hypothetical protein [Clostridia bacterium]